MDFFSENTGLYLFSALLQANAAIIAIVGVFGIFKIQNLQSKIEYIKQGLLHPEGFTRMTGMTPIAINEFDNSTLQKKEEILKESSKHNPQWSDLLKSWINTEKVILSFKPIITKSTIYLGLGIIINALCLILSNVIHSTLKTEELIFGLVLTFQILLITNLVVNIKKFNG